MRGLVLWSVVVVLAVARPARADDALIAKLPKIKNAVAHEHVRKGNAYYRAHEPEKALAEYKLALEIEPADVILYNIGQCDRLLARWEDSIWVYRRFLSQAQPEPALAERVEKAIQDAEKQLAQQREAERKLAEQQAAEQKRAAVQLPPAADTARSGDVAAQPSASVVAGASPPRPTTRLVPGEPWYRDPAAWLVTGAGVVGIGVGGALLASASHLDDQANTTTNQEQRAALHSRASARQTDGFIVGGIGAAAAVAGVVMLIVHPGRHEEPLASSWRLDLTTNGIAIGGRF